jgi:D-alanine-D-alanine ligase
VSEIAKRAYEALKMKGFRIYIGKRRTTHAGNEHHSRINNRKFDSATSQSRGISLEDLFTNAIELALPE